MSSEKDAVKADAAEHDAKKGESGDSSKNVSAAGHQFRNDAQKLAEEGDPVAQNLTKDWSRDLSSKSDVPSKRKPD